VPGLPPLPWAVVLLPGYSFGIALAFPILTLEMLELFPAARGAASSVQSFVTLVSNALLAGVIAPAVAHSLWMIALVALAFTVVAWLLWRRHLAVTGHEPPTAPDAPAYEPLDDC
jgi:DHA1 family bicyclomycin/chloramphenicol resistance-like MFS transporter